MPPVRKGLFFSSLIIALASAVALVIYLKAPASRAISGYVVSAGGGESGRPLSNALVKIESEGGDHYRKSTRTDARGWFTFDELPEGEYQVTAYGDGGAQDSTGRVARGTTLTMRPRAPESKPGR